MKRNLIIACALALGTGVGWAEESTPQQTPAASTGGEFRPQQIQLFNSSLVEKTKVTDKDGKHLGKVQGMLIDALTGRVRFVVVGVDKEWSLDNPEVIIPWGTLQIAPQGTKDYTVRIDATRDKLMNAPRFDKALVQQLTTREAGEPIYSYWGVTGRDEMNRSGTAQTLSPLPAATPGSEPNLNIPPATSTNPIPSAVSSTLPPLQPGTPTAPVTTTDGSTSNQSIGNSGTSDSPKPENKLRQPAPGTPSTPSKIPEIPKEPDQTLGDDESD